MNQFHDVLSGSVIEMAYDDAEKIYAEVAAKGSALLESALKALYPSSLPFKSSNSHSGGDELIAINTSPYPRRELVKISLESARERSDAFIQLAGDSKGAWVLFENKSRAGAGENWTGTKSMKEVEEMKLGVEGRGARAKDLGEEGFSLSNSQLVVKISNQGRITSLFDLEQERELIKEGESGGFVIFEDRPQS